jgi:hypothetical protein
MKIIYEDEYGVDLYEGPSTYPAAVGDSVILNEEEYRIKSRTFYPEQDVIVVTVTQTVIRQAQKEDKTNSRLNEMQNAIVAVTKRQDVSEKKGRALREQIGSVRRHINQRIQQEKKDSQ